MRGVPNGANGQLDWKVKVVREPKSSDGYGNTVWNLDVQKNYDWIILIYKTKNWGEYEIMKEINPLKIGDIVEDLTRTNR